MPEPLNSMALVLIGAALGAWAAGAWCGCLRQARWRRQWLGIAERTSKPWTEDHGPQTTDPDPVRRGFFVLDWHFRRHAERDRRLREVAR